MKKLNYFVSIILILFLLQGCYYDNLPVPKEAELPENVSFSNDVQPIFNINCVSCHGGTQVPNLTSSNSYNELINGNYVVPANATNSKLVNYLLGNGYSIMPPSGALKQSDIDKISQWINEGALNN